jgi:prevent-host-death family protein
MEMGKLRRPDKEWVHHGARNGIALKSHFVRTELVTTLKRKATKIIADLETSQDPVPITQHGKPAAYLIAVETFPSRA